MARRRVLAVSHFYHLPRIKLSYQRAGFEVYTVPARQKYLLSQMPYNMAREVAAFWAYYVKQRPALPIPTRARGDCQRRMAFTAFTSASASARMPIVMRK
jgi:hypothetical protein